MNAALVPIKRLEAAKSRLVDHLGRAQIERLGLAMLEDLGEALQQVPALSRIVVVTPDSAVRDAAEAAGLEGWLRDAPGLNPSLDAATGELAGEGLEALLVVLGDVAAALPEDLSAMFESLDGLGGRGVVLAPSRDGGTGALLRSPFDVIESRFGKHSAAAHRERAQQLRVPYAELPLPSLAIDLDRIEDAHALLDVGRGATRTRALLGEFGIR